MANDKLHSLSCAQEFAAFAKAAATKVFSLEK
jgi:hypothetical protein